jgi:hypothetical protein
MPLSFVGVVLLAMPAFSSSGVIVEVEVDREKVFARGARCVSLSSDSKHVSKLLSKFNGKVQHHGQRAAVSTLVVTSPAERQSSRSHWKGKEEAALTLG